MWLQSHIMLNFTEKQLAKNPDPEFHSQTPLYETQTHFLANFTRRYSQYAKPFIDI